MKIYVYNVNNKNEFLQELEVDSISGWEATATEIKPKTCKTIGKSYAFNPKTGKWSILIDDWRGITLYNKLNSRVTREGDLNIPSNEFTSIVPPDAENEYIFENDQWTLKISQEEYIANELKKYENAIQQYIDEVAQSRGYDNGYTCASYYGDKNRQYAKDARIFKDWRSDVWVYVNELLNSYQAGTLETIPSIEEVINNLPTIEWVDI